MPNAKTAPNSALSRTWQQPATKSRELARQWLVQFAEVTQRDITAALAVIWQEQLGDLDAELLNAACDKLIKTWPTNFLPTPGSIRTQILQAETSAFELESISAWEKARAWNRANWHPDLGAREIWDPKLGRRVPAAKPLAAEIEYAVRAAGGHTAIQNATDDDLVWRRKTFLEAYKTIHETQQSAHLIGSSEAAQILARIHAAPDRARMKPTLEIAPRLQPAPIAAAPAARIEIPKSARELTQEEIEARKNRQREAIREWRVAHGLPADPTEAELEADAAIGRGEIQSVSSPGVTREDAVALSR